MTRRFEDAFTLMEDILSSEPQKLSDEKAKQGILRKRRESAQAGGRSMNKTDLVLPWGSWARHGMTVHNSQVGQIPDTMEAPLVRSKQCHTGMYSTCNFTVAYILYYVSVCTYTCTQSIKYIWL